MVKKRFNYNENAQIRGALRRAFARHPNVQKVLLAVKVKQPRYKKDGSRAKVDAALYLCAHCKKYYNRANVQVDHIDPVISTKDGFVDWNTFISRMFCGIENLQVLCKGCHRVKTNKERKAAT